MIREKEWFGEWFNSPYYHVLYKNRDYKEAQRFIDNLVEYLKITKTDNILDLACGKGRHAIYLHRLGYNVTGIDLSSQNIEFASRFAKIYGDNRLQFEMHDMRQVFRENSFNYVLNIFTSFGYFEKKGENKISIQAAAAALKKGGRLVIDFFNTKKVINTLVPYEEKTLQGITFRIKKELVNGFIVKNITFEDNGEPYYFQEKVKAITKSDFLKYCHAAQLEITDFFGDYDLKEFDPQESERIIFIARK